MFRYFCAGAVALAALTASPVAASEMYVKSANLDCRVGPSTGHHIVSTLQRQSAVKLVDQYDGWASVRAGGAVCWVKKASLAATKEAAAKPAVKVKKVAKATKRHAPSCHYPKPVIILNPDYGHHGAFNTGKCSPYGYGRIVADKGAVHSW